MIENSSAPRPFLPHIESLRGLAALTVAYSHCAIVGLFYAGIPRSPATERATVLVLAPLDFLLNARAAVVVFFVISGLVLSLAVDHARSNQALRDYAAFIGRRALRLYPAHLAALLLFVPIAGLTVFQLPVPPSTALTTPASGLAYWAGNGIYGTFHPFELLKTLVLATNTYNPPVWTLQIELAAAFLLPAFAALSRRGRLDIDAAMLALLTAAPFLLDPVLPARFSIFIPAFYLGCMVRTHGSRIAAAAGVPGRILLLAASILLLLIAETFFGPTDERAVIAMSLAGFGLVTSIVRGAGRTIDSILLNPIARTLGRVSYSFYLWHALVLFAVVRLELMLVPPDSFARWDAFVRLATFAISAPLAFGIATISWRRIERPCIALGRTLGSRAGAPAAGDAPAIGLPACR